MLYNLHTHTYRCNHAFGEDREYVEAAIKSGIKVLGFADHCPQFFPTDYYSSFRMRPEAAAEYVESLRALKEEYKNDIDILIGFETEYYPEIFDKFTEFIAPLDLDYMIMGQHFIHNEYEVPGYYASNPSYEDAEQYVKQTIEGLKTGMFTYIAHPDILRHEDPVFYRELMTGYCKELKEMNIPVEYNILGHCNKKWYPYDLFWEVAAEVGNRVVLGFDAHSPEALSTLEAYNECYEKLRTLGITPAEFEDIKILKP